MGDACATGRDDPLRLQVLNVTEQLDAGVRYLDLRIAHMQEGSERNLHFVHMLYTAVLVEVGRGGADGWRGLQQQWHHGHPRGNG